MLSGAVLFINILMIVVPICGIDDSKTLVPLERTIDRQAPLYDDMIDENPTSKISSKFLSLFNEVNFARLVHYSTKQ